MKDIRLFSQNGNVSELKLNTVRKPYIVEEILGNHCKVYGDMEYSFILNSSRDIFEVSVFINGNKMNCYLQDNMVYFAGDNKSVFSHIIGFAEIVLKVTFASGEESWYYSDLAAVLVKANHTNKLVDSMLKYVYENQEDILYRESKITGVGRNQTAVHDDFWSQISLLEEIANVYESSYGYFMANCRFELEPREVVDRVERLQTVDSKTMQYVVQHPEYLKVAVSGVQFGRQSFLPTKTLMQQNRVTKDIYENQVVMNFLDTVLVEIGQLTEKISNYTVSMQSEAVTEDGYIVSSHLLFQNAKEVLGGFLDRLTDIHARFSKLFFSYSRVFGDNIKKEPITSCPRPTPIFLNLPQYHRVYNCIMRWFSKSGYDLVKERTLLNFIDAPAVYEAYVLIKLINAVKSAGFDLVESQNIVYPKQGNIRVHNRGYKNMYLFRNENSEITIYYEPVIYDEDKTYINQLALYRNNIVSMIQDTEEERQGHCYVPDYVIKYSEAGKEKYLICDAKFSRKQKVQFQLMPELIYKYIVSLSPCFDEAKVCGLCVFYGITDGDEDMVSFYDRQLSSAKKIEPRIELFPFGVDVEKSHLEANSIEMLRMLLGRS